MYPGLGSFIVVTITPITAQLYFPKQSSRYNRTGWLGVNMKLLTYPKDSDSLFTKFYNKEGVSKAVSIQT